jgi:hypothetical protein
VTGAEVGGFGGRAASVIPGAPVPASPSSRRPLTAPTAAVKPAVAAWKAPPSDAGGQGPGPLQAVPISAAAAAGRLERGSGPSAVHAQAIVAVYWFASRIRPP